MSAPAAREIEAQSLEFGGFEEVFASDAPSNFKSRDARHRPPRIGFCRPGYADHP